MDDKSRFALYEKLYFHELDRKDKLLARLNLPLAMIAGLLSFFGYLLNKAPSSSDGWPGVFSGYSMTMHSSFFCWPYGISEKPGYAVNTTTYYLY